jgi:hypothetical protein
MHACNPSYSGGRDLEDLWQIVPETLSGKNPITKRAGRVAQVEGPEVQAPVPKNRTTTKHFCCFP